MIFNNIANALKTSGQLPLDAKTYFITLAEMADLGTQSNKAFLYYEHMHAVCVETGLTYVWKEVDQSYTGGVVSSNFQYPSGAVTDDVDYSGRYFNFVVQDYEQANNGPKTIFWNEYRIEKKPTNILSYPQPGDEIKGRGNGTLEGGDIVHLEVINAMPDINSVTTSDYNFLTSYP